MYNTYRFYILCHQFYLLFLIMSQSIHFGEFNRINTASSKLAVVLTNLGN